MLFGFWIIKLLTLHCVRYRLWKVWRPKFKVKNPKFEAQSPKSKSEVSWFLYISIIYLVSIILFNCFVLQDFDFGLWTLDFGLSTTDFGQWTSVYGLWTSDYEHWTTDFGLWTSEHGIWTMDWGNVVHSSWYSLLCSTHWVQIWSQCITPNREVKKKSTPMTQNSPLCKGLWKESQY